MAENPLIVLWTWIVYFSFLPIKCNSFNIMLIHVPVSSRFIKKSFGSEEKKINVHKAIVQSTVIKKKSTNQQKK